jgi:hypothetical protein
MTPEEVARRKVGFWHKLGYAREAMDAIEREEQDRGGLSLRDKRLVEAAIAELYGRQQGGMSSSCCKKAGPIERLPRRWASVGGPPRATSAVS